MAKKVQLDTMTGEQFKELIEQFTQDSRVNTIPELIAALSDIPEGVTLGQYIQEHSGQVAPEVLKESVDEAVDQAMEEIKDQMMTQEDRVTQEELDNFNV